MISMQIVFMIVAIILNFNEAWFGHPVIARNVVVTVAYICSWIALLVVGFKKASKKALIFSVSFWAFFLVLLLWYFLNYFTNKINDINTLIFLPITFHAIPLYGLNLFQLNTRVSFVIIVFLTTLVFFIASIIIFRKLKGRFGG